MSDLRTAAQQALEVLGKWSSGSDMDAVELNDLIATLEAALEQPEQEPVRLQCVHCGTVYTEGVPPAVTEQEPVASIYVTIGGDREFDDWRCPLPVGGNLLYTHPPRREWRGLTLEEVQDSYNADYQAQTRAIEAALKERNA